MIEQSGTEAIAEKPVFPLGDGDFSVIAAELPDGSTMSFDAGKLVIKKKHLTPGADMKVGDVREDGTVYIGTWSPSDRDGKSLGKIFDLYAVHEDIKNRKSSWGEKLFLTFNKAVKHVAGLRNYHGYNGFKHKAWGKTPDEALYGALRTGRYNGEWFIPTLDILHGKDMDGKQIQFDNLYAYRNQGKLKGTFTTAIVANARDWYWSCTEHPRHSSNVYIVNIMLGITHTGHRNLCGKPVRPVRAELRL